MDNTNEISIKKLIVHILDNNLQMPVLSEQEHELNSEISEFIEKHINKILKDDRLKEAIFLESSNQVKNLCESLGVDTKQFPIVTAEISSILFNIMQKHVDIPPADMIFCILNFENDSYLGMIKLNYRHSYIHYIERNEAGNLNSIIKQKTALPLENQKIDECAIINLNDLSIKLLEKKYEINGEKLLYFSNMFLRCTSKISTSEKVKLFNKTTEKFSKQYFEEDYTKPVEIQKAVAESIDATETIDVVDIAEKVFRKSPQLKEEYIEEIEKVGLKEKVIPVSQKMAQKKFMKHKIKTDSGIEINLPVEYYGNDEKIEFINNPDGTVSIMIKNIGQIMR